MITVQKSTPRDIGPLVDMDLKSHEYPWPTDNWATVMTRPDVVIFIATSGVKPAGFCVFAVAGAELSILRFGVIPKYRRMKVASMIMSNLNNLANSLKADRMSVVVPEIHCLPGHPDDVSSVLGRAGFLATEVIKDRFLMYGGQVDGFKFVKELI